MDVSMPYGIDQSFPLWCDVWFWLTLVEDFLLDPSVFDFCLTCRQIRGSGEFLGVTISLYIGSVFTLVSAGTQFDDGLAINSDARHL